MKTKFVEVTNGPRNHGKFMLAEFDTDDWNHPSAVAPGYYLLRGVCGWGQTNTILVLDLQTGEGALFSHGGYAKADLDKHRVWVCPMFEPFLTWLYEQDVSDLDALPDHVDLPEAPFSMYGYRRPGPCLCLEVRADPECPIHGSEEISSGP